MPCIVGGLDGPAHLGGFLVGGDPFSWTPKVWDYLIAEFHPESVLDVGCGEGHAAQYFLDLGLDAHGVDGSDEAQQSTVLPADRFISYDFASPSIPPAELVRPFDLIWTCEFLEHVEEKWLGNVLSVLARGSIVAVTHALPNQDGYHHVNCRELEYWIEQMRVVGLQYDEHRTKQSRELLADYDYYWKRTGAIFTMPAHGLGSCGTRQP